MDSNHFDAWTRRLQSRRGVMKDLSVGVTLVGLGLGVGLGTVPRTSAAPTPTKKPKRPTFGCTKQDNACKAGTTVPTPCPTAPAGSDGTCVNDNKGKPFCATIGVCAPCTKNRDCADAGPGALCIKKCPVCQAQGGKSACLVPLTNA